jgi:hypothetical protein
MRFRSFAICVCLLTINVWTAPVSAQDWTVDLSGAATSPLGVTKDHLKPGWNINVGADKEIASGFGIRGDFGYYHLGVSDQTLQTLQMPSGDARMLSLTVGPTWRFPIGSRVNGYALGGVGWYRRTVEFTQPTLALIDIIDAWWGYVGSEIVPANQILGTVSNNAFGGNIGGGIGIPLGGSGAEVFVETRYHYANTKNSATHILPVSFGFRLTGKTLGAP